MAQEGITALGAPGEEAWGGNRVGKAVSRGAWKVAPVQGVPGLQMKGQTEGVAARGGARGIHTQLGSRASDGTLILPQGEDPPSPPTWHSGEAGERHPDPTPPRIHGAGMVLAGDRQLWNPLKASPLDLGPALSLTQSLAVGAASLGR